MRRPAVPAQKLLPQFSPAGNPYWHDERIRQFGNTGLGGWLHALVAPLATRIIDATSYSGVDVRALVEATVPRGASVLVHCLAGAHRAGTAAVLLLMHKHGWDAASAIAAAKQLRPIINPIGHLPGLLLQKVI